MSKQTKDIIGDIIATLSVTFVIDNVISNGGGSYTLETKCTWWLSIEKDIIVGGNAYKITSFILNKSITIQSIGSPILPTVASFTIPAPNYINGTLKMAQNEVDAQKDKTILCPFVYLIEIISDDKNNDDESMIDRTTDLRLLFLNSVDTGNWLTNDHYTNFVYPMQQMVDLFVSKVKNSNLFVDNIRYIDTPLINVSENGTQVKSIFDCNLSGIEHRLFAEIREELSCINQCGCN